MEIKRRIAAVTLSATLLAACLLASGVILAYLTEYGTRRIAAAAVIAALGLGLAIAGHVLVLKTARRAGSAPAIVVLVLVLVLAPVLSMFYPGRISHARFGLTVYGLIPVPSLDITIGAHGGLWFRDKSHWISLQEVQPLLTEDVDVLVIGTGWQDMARVDPAIHELEGVEIHSLPTPQAFELFNRYRSEGKRVVIIAHATC